MDGRTLLLGDWTPIVRDPIDVLRGALIIGTVAALAAGETSGAVYLGVGAIAALIARIALLPRVLDLAFVGALTLTGFGEALGVYDARYWFDSVVHTIVPLLFAPVGYVALARAEVLPDPKHVPAGLRSIWVVWVVAWTLGIAFGALWEIVEFASDGVLGSSLQESNADTVRDLIADTVGAAIGAGLLVLWTRHGWGSVRRIPGENRFEATSG